ncbi:hypothetical protein [Spiroplasma taiwanense]|uniref:Uncharacterized protein n=1 Tax=Spiroplasma taiwanense CT-1 TaxID=1276220 RepID=S5LWU5_9MOLU|nr:hypothetical protein [Spiroplasma taiwanense]AGR41106.1 hypothetical protein STAIW_v1c04600 [Spiroplasma taiwanense CT-1]
MNGIIPKKLGSQKLKVKGNVTIIDLVCILVFIVIAVAVAAPLTIIGWLGQTIIGVAIFLTLTVLLIPNKKTGMRLYNLIYFMFKFKSSKKEFLKESSENNTALLMPYKELVDNNDDLGIIKTDFLYENTAFYIAAIEIEGFNILNMSFEEQERKINAIKNLWANLEINCSLIKIEKT